MKRDEMSEKKCVYFVFIYIQYTEYLEYLRTNGYKINERTYEAAAGGGQLACMKYAEENGVLKLHMNTTARTCALAAKGGHLECLRYVFSVQEKAGRRAQQSKVGGEEEWHECCEPSIV
jgi:hypothetical protein